MLINVTNQKHQGFILIFLESRSEHFQENVLKKKKKKNGQKEQGKIVIHFLLSITLLEIDYVASTYLF